MCRSVGLTSLGLYLPAKPISKAINDRLLSMLKDETLLHRDYIDQIDETNCLPGQIETNYDGWQRHSWYKKWLEHLPEPKRSDPFQGTQERRRVPLDPVSITDSMFPHPMLPSDAETIAGALALVNAGIERDEIDQLITASQVPDLPLPPNSSLVQHKLQLKNAGAFEIDSCCSSFVSMIEVASALVKAGVRKKVLIIASYIDSLVTDKSSYFSVNTGDAAVAGIVSEVEDGSGYISSHSTSHGSRHNGIILEKRQPKLVKSPAQYNRYEQEFVTFYNPQANKEIAANSQRDMQEVVRFTLSKAGLGIDDIDFFVTHQPVSWAGHAWREALAIPQEKFYESFCKYGNIACCSAPTNLGEAIESGLVKPGDMVLIASSGAGENHVAAIQRITKELVQSVTGQLVQLSIC